MPTPTLAIVAGQVLQTQHESFTCPHCGLAQANKAHSETFEGFLILIRQCLTCKSLTINGYIFETFPDGTPKPRGTSIGRLYPQQTAKPTKHFSFVPPEVQRAYEDACYLLPIHSGAAGAYARRALELILENLGYGSRVLAQSIVAAGKEKDPDKRIRKHLLIRLDYIKEIGNFALHVRRDDALAIIDVTEEEVQFCIDTIEELIIVSFEEPGENRQKIIDVNAKLQAAQKTTIPVPDPVQALPPSTDALEEAARELGLKDDSAPG